MGWVKERREWESKLLGEKAQLLSKFHHKDLESVGGKRWMEEMGNQKESLEVALQPRETGVRVSFPLKLGVGSGMGTSSPTLHIVQMNIGSEVFAQEDGLTRGRTVVRPKRSSRPLIRKVETAGNFLNAAIVLLLSQAVCGPVISLAMTCMATLKFSHFAVQRIMNHVNGVDAQSLWMRVGVPAPVNEFSTVSLLLSIGVPILKRHNPKVHNTFECLGAAIPVALGYAQTTALVKDAQLRRADGAELLWRQCHRWAAKRLCGYLSEYRHPPTIGWFVDAWEKTSVIIVPNSLTNNFGVMVSIPLPLKRSSDKFVLKQPMLAKDKVHSRPAPPDDVEVIRRRPWFLTEDVNGQQDVVSDWGEGENNMYLEFSAVQSGWRLFQQRWSLILRGCYLLLVFGPLMIVGSVIYFLSSVMPLSWGLQLRKALWWLLRFCLEKGGAAFIKWGQWSATREDLFPEDLCHYLGRLHDQAPEHSYSETRKAIVENLGRSIEDIFEDFPRKPCASGSIAQVYKAKLKDQREGMPAEVAVKVRHPSVALRIFQDFQIMAALAKWAQGLPALRWLKLQESVDQFSHTLTAQADLRVEADNLARFHQNFETLSQIIIFPKLIPDLVSAGVIVESFEPGQALREYLRTRTSLNAKIAAAGVDTYLKMLLTDNFVHTDLHPGNILARSAVDQQSLQQQIQLVLLDFGLAEELTPIVRYHFLSFIIMIGAGNGELAARHLLQFSWPHEQTCTSPELLVEDMKVLFTQECNLLLNPIDLNKVLIKVLQLCRKHEVTIDSAYASLVVAVCVLVGFARSLDPDLSIMDAAVPCLFLYNLTGRIMGGIYG